MENNYWIIKHINCDPNELNATNGRFVVSFEAKVLDKYKNNPDYEIKTPQNVVLLISKKQAWQLQIDVHDEYVNTWLYKMGDLTEDEQAHFAKHNIKPKDLSIVADNRWNKGIG